MRRLTGKRGQTKEKPSRKTLYLHIGHYKTGTSALQIFLDENRKVLRRNGLDYLDHTLVFSKHSRYAFSLLREYGVKDLMHGYSNKTPAAQLWSDLFEAVRKSPRRTCLISSEEFMRLGSFDGMAERLAAVVEPGGDIDIRVIAYLRPPASHLRSWYNQLVKMGEHVPAFNAAVTDVIEPVHYDYRRALAPWVEVFGPDALIVRPYDPAMKNSDALYADFLSIFGLELAALPVKFPDEDPNPRLDESRLELVRLMRSAGIPEATATWMEKRFREFEAREETLSHGMPTSFASVIERSANGLREIANLPGCTVDTDTFAQLLPDAGTERESDLFRLVGFLMAELRHSQEQVAKNQHAIKKQLSEIEEKLARIDESSSL